MVQRHLSQKPNDCSPGAEVERGALSASFAKIENTELLVGGWRKRERKGARDRAFLAEWVVGAKKW